MIFVQQTQDMDQQVWAAEREFDMAELNVRVVRDVRRRERRRAGLK